MNLVVTPTLSNNRRGLTSEQAKAAYADGHVAVVAGAGTGKTHMLSERYLHLLMHHGFSPLEIVAVTFTRKAAAELRSRIRQTVTQALPDQPRYLAELEAARISTIDALAMRICEEHPEAAGVPADFTLLDDIEGQIRDQEYLEMALDQLPERFYRQIPYSLIEAVMRIGLIDPLSAEKALSCDSSQWPVLVEDAVKAAKAALLRSHDWQQSKQILASHCGQADDKLEAVRQSAIQAITAIENDYNIGANLSLIQTLRINAGIKKNWQVGALESVKSAIKSLREIAGTTAKQGLITLFLGEIDDRLAAMLPTLREILTLVRGYIRDAKDTDRVLSFSDVEVGAIKALQQESVKQYYQKRWRAFLIDEFQDTSPNQGAILEALTENAIITIVGDEKQSIYGFRRADITVFQDWREHIRLHNGEVSLLGTSFRSHRPLVEQVNQIFRPVLGDLHQDLVAHREQAPNQQPHIRLCCVTLDDEEKADKQKKQYIEAKHIAQEIKQMLQAEILVYDKPTQALRPIQRSDIAVLSRTWEPLENYGAALESQGIPTVQVGGGNLLDTREAKDAIALLRFLVDPSDDLALIATLRSPFFAISDRTLFQVAQPKGKQSWWTYLKKQKPPELARAIAILGELRREVNNDVPTVLLQRANALTGYSAVIANLPGAKRRQADWSGFLDVLHQEEVNDSDSSAIIRRIKRWETAGVKLPRPILAAGDAIALMTIHASKGLEWSVVVVPDLSRKAAIQVATACFDPALGMALKLPNEQAELEKPALFRLIEQAQKQREHEESKRLLYVALTRARDHLLLTSAEEHGGNLELLRDCLVEAIPYKADLACPIVPPMPTLPTIPSTQLLHNGGPGITELPVTALTEYGRCPKQFHYHHVEGHLGYREGVGNFAAQVGTLTHLALEQDVQTLAALMPMADGLSVEKVAEAFELAQQFRRSPTFEALREIGAEYERSVTLALPQLTLRGQIDLVGRDWVADFKTDQEMNPQAHRFQLWAYAQAAGKPVAHIAYLRTDTLHTFTTEDLQAIGQEATTIIQGIRSGDFESTPTVKVCGSCAYAEICTHAKKDAG